MWWKEEVKKMYDTLDILDGSSANESSVLDCSSANKSSELDCSPTSKSLELGLDCHETG